MPPIYQGDNIPIARIGIQKTYVFHKDGVETFVIRPGYSGKVDQFGMLIPFPNPPSLRKVSDDVFSHIAAAVDPPEIVIDLTPYPSFGDATDLPMAAKSADKSDESDLSFHSVRVLKQEAVGMYEVTVLEAGSADALNRWMTDHGYRYPEGMDDVCNEYVELKWCFVAVRTRVGQKAGVDPRPGMREVDAKLPPQSTFDGHVQGMGFRFKTDELVVPMRLSAFNEGDLRNIVYLLTDEPVRANSMPSGFVVRQLSGAELHRNVTAPLPLRLIGGKYKDIPDWRKQSLPQERDPIPHNGIARDLFASDLLAVSEDQMAHPHEETEKVLLRIGERLGLRGPDIDALHDQAVATDREKIVKEVLEGLKDMTLTVIDGDFPKDVIARENVTFASFAMNKAQNDAKHYDAKQFGPVGHLFGQRIVSEVRVQQADGGTIILQNAPGWLERKVWRVFIGVIVFVVIGLVVFRFRKRPTTAGTAALLLGLAVASSSFADGQDNDLRRLISNLSDSQKADAAVAELVKHGEIAVPLLIGEAEEGNDLTRRGWAFVCLAEIGGTEADEALAAIHDNGNQSSLVRTWAIAARINNVKTTDGLIRLSENVAMFPATRRPFGRRLAALTQQGDKGESVEGLLRVSTQLPQVRQSLVPAVLAYGRKPLITVMLTGNDNEVRREAAAYLATLALQDEKVASDIAAAYQFDPQAKTVTWNGGALFIPALNWDKQNGRALAGHLMKWMLWCDHNRKQGIHNQIQNNLSSVQLTQAAGYGWPSEYDAVGWLTSWKRVVGQQGIEKILSEQGVQNDARYRSLLE